MAEARFKIEITEVGEELGVIPKRWEKVGENDDGTPRYDYTPETETYRKYERVIYAQNAAGLNLEAIICAVNGITTTPKGGA